VGFTTFAEESELEITAAGNSPLDKDDKLRIRVGSSGQLVIEKLESVSWVNKHRWT
jgi:hypothetical protein